MLARAAVGAAVVAGGSIAAGPRSARGQRSIEHIHAIALSVSSRETEIRRMLQATTLQTGDYRRAGPRPR
ncbi:MULTISPECIES: hypothetical protein [Kribbella]|uniref:hypothetical protein n=1 Tax=Kribbella TaxID=182639 RepID=UPI001F546815|nr:MULTISPECIES: hypothetical protein [Kribbella]